MMRRCIALALVALLSHLWPNTLPAGAAQTANQPQPNSATEQARACATRHSAGAHATRIELRLRDGRKVKGEVGAARDNFFTIINPTTGASTSVFYDEVTQVRCGGSARANRRMIGIGIALGLLVVVLAALARNDT